MGNDTYFRSTGRSSKMEALIVDVRADLSSSKRFVTFTFPLHTISNVDSIIFSCWTRTLDLMQYYLRNAGILFQRIDGECATAKRVKILDDFAQIPHLRVLIMTTGTGAVG